MKNVVITGHTSGIGNACLELFLKEQWNVLGVSRNGVSGSGWGKMTQYIYDLSNREERYQFVAEVDSVLSSERQYLDVLINNAGIFELEEVYPESFNRLIATNMEAPYYLCKEFYDRGLLIDGSVVINIASISGINGEPDNPIYAMTKAGVINLTKSLARKWAMQGIRVLSVSPGYVKTNLCPGDTPLPLLESIPLKREAQPYEIASVIYSAISCLYMTGSNIVIDGGITC